MEKKLIGIIGNFGDTGPTSSGQIIKTRMLYDGLMEEYGGNLEIVYANTALMFRRPVSFLISFARCVIRCRSVIVLLSKNGRRFLFPLMYYLSESGGKMIFHYAIGGRLADEVESKKNYKKYVRSFQKNWVEARSLADRLISLGVENAEYMPNFKRLNAFMESSGKNNEIIRFCTFSRVTEKKGISDAIQAIIQTNKKMGLRKVELDIYGQIDPAYEHDFQTLLKESGDEIRYCGVVAPEDSIRYISNYHALLFPTRFYREGIPGTIIDAFSAGIPVIARQWQYGAEMLTHGKTGFLYAFDKPEELEYWIRYCCDNTEELVNMEADCKQASKEYQSEYVIKLIYEQIKDKL